MTASVRETMQHKHLRFGHGFQVMLSDLHSQAAQMTLAPGATEGGPDNNHQGADQWLCVVSGSGEAEIDGERVELRGDTDPHPSRREARNPKHGTATITDVQRLRSACVHRRGERVAGWPRLNEAGRKATRERHDPIPAPLPRLRPAEHGSVYSPSSPRSAQQPSQRCLELADLTGVGRVGIEVVQLGGIALQVEQLPLAEPVVVDQLPLERPNAVVGLGVEVREVVAVIHRRPPVRGPLPCQEWAEAPALRGGGNSHAGVVEQGRRKVDVQDNVVVDAPRRNFSRPANEQRHPERLLVHEPLVVEAVLAEEAALVGGVDHDRLAGQSCSVEVIEQSADVVIHRGNAAEVGLDESLVLHLGAGLAAQVPGLRGELGMLKTDLLLSLPQGDAARPSPASNSVAGSGIVSSW